MPEVLHHDAALMRVLVDKHFVDNWVLAWAPGFTSDLAREWANYKVGRRAGRRGFSIEGVGSMDANEEMARECAQRPVTLDGLVPTADHNDSCHFTMTGGV